jgi:hypothetical protein
MFCTTTLFWSNIQHPPLRERHFGHFSRHPSTCDSQQSLEVVCWTRHERFRASAGIKKGSDERRWVEIKKQLKAFSLAQNSRLMVQTRWSPGQRESYQLFFYLNSTLLFTKFKWENIFVIFLFYRRAVAPQRNWNF